MRATAVFCVLLMLGTAEIRADMIGGDGIPPWEHCALCHGLNGISRMAKFPKLAGQRYAYLAKQLRDFKSAHRDNDGGPMAGTAEQFDIPSMLKAAKWFSSQPDPPPVDGDPEESGEGRILFEQGKPGRGVPACRSCHGANASSPLIAPRLEAQHAGYLAKQLHDFRNKSRTNDPNEIMQKIASFLDDREITSLAAYLASQARAKEVRP